MLVMICKLLRLSIGNKIENVYFLDPLSYSIFINYVSYFNGGSLEMVLNVNHWYQ